MCNSYKDGVESQKETGFNEVPELARHFGDPVLQDQLVAAAAHPSPGRSEVHFRALRIPSFLGFVGTRCYLLTQQAESPCLFWFEVISP